MEILTKILELLPIVAVIIIFIVSLIITIKGSKTKVKNWLVWAVSEAEALLGSGTGKLKLRYVYDTFVSKFPIFSTFISFDTFSAWVDEALATMKNFIETNNDIKQIIVKEEK